MAELSFENVAKVYQDGGDGVVAVEDLNLDIKDGEFLVLVGPSGCGKSTTLRMIAGLETPTSGEIRLGGESITDHTPQERDIAMVFQSYALYPHMTVRQNMSFGLEESTDLSKAEISERVEEAASMLGIEPLIDRKPGELSGGQQQRVALGRSIVRDPQVFLLDEPLSNLDAKLRAQMRTELKQLQDDLGTTTVYVTHDQTEAMTMSDRLAILNDGRLQQVGTPLECYHQPNNTFVAGFLGDPPMNFYDGSLEGGALVTNGFRYALSEEMLDAVTGYDAVRLGIRPEDIEIHRTADRDNDFPAVVNVVEPQGNENTVHLQLKGESGSGEKVTVSVGGMQAPETGEEVAVRFPTEAIHLFDAETGKALHNRSLTTGDARNEVDVSS